MSLFNNPLIQIVDGNGDPINGARYYFFEQNTSTLKTIYSDSGLSLPMNNPVESTGIDLDSIWLDGLYKVVIKDGAGSTIKTFPTVGALGSGQLLMWDSGKIYSINDLVIGSDGNFYNSLIGGNIAQDPTITPSAWEMLEFIGHWNSTINYGVNAVVFGSDMLLYHSQAPDNLNNDPTTERIKWWPGSPQQPSVTAAGTNAYTATYGETAYKIGRRYCLTFTNANTSTNATLNLDALGAISIKMPLGATLGTGYIRAGYRGIVEYDGTYFILLNAQQHNVKVSGDDTTPQFLQNKIISAGSSITITTSSPGGDERLNLELVTLAADLVGNTALKNGRGTNDVSSILPGVYWTPAAGWYNFSYESGTTLTWEIRIATTWRAVSFINQSMGGAFCDGINMRFYALGTTGVISYQQLEA